MDLILSTHYRFPSLTIEQCQLPVMLITILATRTDITYRLLPTLGGNPFTNLLVASEKTLTSTKCSEAQLFEEPFVFTNRESISPSPSMLTHVPRVIDARCERNWRILTQN